MAYAAKIVRVGKGNVDVQLTERELISFTEHEKECSIITGLQVATFKFGSFTLSTPLKVGDSVLVLCTDGRTHTDVHNQKTVDRHNYENGIVIAGLNPTGSDTVFGDDYIISANDTPVFTISADGSTTTINTNLVVNGSQILNGTQTLNGDLNQIGNQMVIGSETVTGNISSLGTISSPTTDLDTHTHLYSPGSGTPTQTGPAE